MIALLRQAVWIPWCDTVTTGELIDHVELVEFIVTWSFYGRSLRLRVWYLTRGLLRLVGRGYPLTLVLNKPPVDPLRAQSARNRLAASPVFFACTQVTILVLFAAW